MKDIIPKFREWPIWTDEDVEAVADVVRTGQWWCGAPESHAGEQVWKFQEEFAKFQEVNHAFACTNGTHAIEIALMALGIGIGDEVIVSDWTFLASGSAVVSVNAVPIFCDIDTETFLMDPEILESLVTERTKAIICVHLGGMPCEMDRIMEIARKFNLKVIEDCAHAHGSKYKGKMVGTWGDCGTFSFQASKVITAGEGGAIVCKDDDLAKKIYSVLDSGRKPGKWFYDHFSYGSDFRLGEMNAALLRVQLKRYPQQLQLRNDNALYMNEKLSEIPGVHPQKRSDDVQSCAQYVYPVYFDPEFFGGIGYKKMYEELEKARIPADACYPPLHSLDLFKDVDLMPNVDYSNANWGREKSKPSNFPNIEKIHANAFELDHRIFLSNQKALDYVVETIKKIQQKYYIK
ncbi:MAG: DegT/DnrJ/EryC1/StrS family aminotransferase [Promethearchaeota archaeon]